MMKAYKLIQPWMADVLILGTEQMTGITGYRSHETKSPFIAIPYPSYGHLTTTSRHSSHLFEQERRVLIFIAARDRHPQKEKRRLFWEVRHSIMTQFRSKTQLPIKEYYQKKGLPQQTTLKAMWLEIGSTCDIVNKTMEWMRNSVFCLQPPGDTATRKSFFDSILSGCIPVIFEANWLNHVTYPFEDVLDYSKFTVTVPGNGTFWETLGPYEEDLEKVRVLQQNLVQVMKYMQYSYPVKTGPHDDTMELIINEIGTHIVHKT